MKKIAVICTLYGPNGGTGRVTTELFERFAQDGDQVHVFCAKRDEEYAKTSKVNSIVDLQLTRIGVLQPLHLLIKASLTVRKKDYDIVYTTGDFYYSPDIVTVHMLKKVSRKIIDKLTKSGVLDNTHSRVKRTLRKIYLPVFYEIGEQFVYRRKKCLYIGVSRGVTQEFCGAFKQTDGENTVSVLNGVDFKKFRRNESKRKCLRKKLRISSDSKVLLFAGSDWNIKRLEVAIKVCSEFPKYHLVIAGKDKTEKYKALTKELGCVDQVHFVGFVNNLEDYYSMADYFLFTSVYETFGLVALEAMAAGMIVISNNLNGVREFIRHGENGFIADGGQADSFVEVLRYLEEHSEIESSVRLEAIKTAEKFTWDNCYKMYKEIFDKYQRNSFERREIV